MSTQNTEIDAKRDLQWSIDNITYELKKGNITMAAATDEIMSLIICPSCGRRPC